MQTTGVPFLPILALPSPSYSPTAQASRSVIRISGSRRTSSTLTVYHRYAVRFAYGSLSTVSGLFLTLDTQIRLVRLDSAFRLYSLFTIAVSLCEPRSALARAHVGHLSICPRGGVSVAVVAAQGYARGHVVTCHTCDGWRGWLMCEDPPLG